MKKIFLSFCFLFLNVFLISTPEEDLVALQSSVNDLARKINELNNKASQIDIEILNSKITSLTDRVIVLENAKSTGASGGSVAEVTPAAGQTSGEDSGEDSTKPLKKKKIVASRPGRR